MPLRIRVISDNKSLLGDRHTIEFAACGGTVGRNHDNDWVLTDPHRYISGRHALIDVQCGTYYLVDTSRNGVYINNADAPVGRGHPQRLFDGDRLRLGDYDMICEIIEDGEDALDDGMRDSVVRAQLVEEDESMELQLVDENRITEESLLAKHLAAGDAAERDSEHSERIAAHKILDDMDATNHTAEDKALEIFLEAAGLKPTDLAGVNPADVLQTAGLLLNGLVEGLMTLMRQRTHLKSAFRLSQTIIQGGGNNPLKFSPTVAEALQYLLGDRSESYLSSREAITAAFREIDAHEQAVPRAMAQAMNDFMERFDPEELRLQFDQGLKRNPLLAGTNRLKYWELYEETYSALAHGEGGKLPEAFSEEFARAYEREVESIKVRAETKSGSHAAA